MLTGKRILLGVTGGIAAYKAVYLLREFQKSGADVRVTLTPSATRFVSPETFTTLSRYPAAIDIFHTENAETSWTQHIHLAEWADLYVIAPCTANSLSKLVHGLADNMLTSIALAARCPMLLSPTMDGEMYDHPAVQKNIESALSMGFHIIEPDTGYLASGLEAKGRLPEPADILNKVADILNVSEPDKVKTSDKGSTKTLAGKKVLVTAGPTREFLDPVRFFSNPSSGKMGIAMADAAFQLGADLTLLTGAITEQLPDYLQPINKSFTSAEDLFDQVKQHSDADIVIMSAAVSDYTPVSVSEQKVKKSADEMTIALRKNPDILRWLGDHKKEGQILIGFAMETENVQENADRKRIQKNLDWICANTISDSNKAFGSDDNILLLIGERKTDTYSGKKTDIARQILNDLFS